MNFLTCKKMHCESHSSYLSPVCTLLYTCDTRNSEPIRPTGMTMFLGGGGPSELYMGPPEGFEQKAFNSLEGFLAHNSRACVDAQTIDACTAPVPRTDMG